MRVRSRGVFPAIVLCSGIALAQAVVKPNVAPVVPVMAELTADLQSSHLQLGGVVHAKVLADWKGPNCVLPRGSVIEGRIAALTTYSSTSKNSQLALAFDRVPCGDSGPVPYPLILIDVAARRTEAASAADDLPRPLGGYGGGGFRSALSDNAEAAYDLDYFAGPDKQELHPGRVYGIKGMTLSAATGPRNSSVLIYTGREVFLLKHTLLLLVPRVVLAPKSADARHDPGKAVENSGVPPGPSQ
jgi:hypothetical protein